ncbi:hypothetical protein MBM_06287 [Drepanopeziza brunnea f. sp. 'multigermtubi' MB_m1]|uniref:Uncharacterized protein n=1 Tax=Marssonina brunnea f. sp. multigermtubi (strain MB_m1) TaxID=1072389 RepID=K1XT70_MARBU|nr:uncharacterized protein MBM_06287 [Drepanopeziza brunnea f. sp. 'multigermtubi' MB_m1]EKD15659.1 hypothetical protein MBM_06287 [Drepanopeziza brunnea f. sp. 'multigermtubi' MB_m1]
MVSNGFPSEAIMAGSGYVNENQPFGNNPFVSVPSDVDRNPFRLVLADLGFIVYLRSLLIQIILPMGPQISGELDELYLSWANIKDLTIHAVLLATQILLLLSMPALFIIFWLVPGVVPIILVAAFWGSTWVGMRLLNGWRTTECQVGLPDGLEPVNDEKELWFFINGVATGKNWLQSNLDLLARTFQREIVGIRNTTNGFIFDLIECLIQRDLDYKTRDIRQGRAQIRAAVAAPATKKVVLILHSQGGIEGSSILDWLLADLSHEVMAKLEIYTFGNAARRFNNPLVSKPASPLVDESKGGRGERVIRHMEHYANSRDFVANIGVLEFTSPKAQPFTDGNAFFGTVFVREGPGHLLNMHYLDKMFTMVNGVVDEAGNTFMNSLVPRRNPRHLPSKNSDKAANFNGTTERKMIKDVSRLWQYINGKSPKDDDINRSGSGSGSGSG